MRVSLPPGTQRPRRRRRLDWELITCGVGGHALVGGDAQDTGDDPLIVSDRGSRDVIRASDAGHARSCDREADGLMVIGR